MINARKIEYVKGKIYLHLLCGSASTFPQPPISEPERLAYTRI